MTSRCYFISCSSVIFAAKYFNECCESSTRRYFVEMNNLTNKHYSFIVHVNFSPHIRWLKLYGEYMYVYLGVRKKYRNTNMILWKWKVTNTGLLLISLEAKEWGKNTHLILWFVSCITSVHKTFIFKTFLGAVQCCTELHTGMDFQTRLDTNTPAGLWCLWKILQKSNNIL